ncbi:MAG: hypothetical protein FVQ83_03040 [Chloroflexi bacterium]|nr:hypothetical protein [Chloroflexota bacterium]
MDDPIFFKPPRLAGNIFHSAVILALSVSIVWLFNEATQAEIGPVFLISLLGALFLAMPLPLLVYRMFALNRAGYVLGREGLRVQWGLRVEDIPITHVKWVQLAETLDQPLVLPRIRWPGSLLGVQHFDDVDAVEFLASDVRHLVVVATQENVFVISPADSGSFLQVFQEQMELGSLRPLAPRSIHANFLLAEVWESPIARVLIIVGLMLNLALLTWVAITVPLRETVALGFTPNGSLLPPVPAAQLFLLPAINVFFFLGNFVLAVFFYRQKKDPAWPFLLWGSSVLTAILFLGGVYIILRAG